MKQLTENIIAIKVPSDATEHCITHNSMWYSVSYRLPNTRPKPFGWTNRPLPSNFKYEIIGLLSQIQNDEGKCAELIPSHEIPFSEGTFCYQDVTVTNGFKAFDTAIEAFQSLIEREKMFTVNPLTKPTFQYEFGEDGPTDEQLQSAQDDYEYDCIMYKQMEANVGEYLILKRAS